MDHHPLIVRKIIAVSQRLKGTKNSATLKLPFWDTDFKLFTKKQKIQKEALTLPRFPVQEIQSEKSAMGGRA